MTWPSSAVEPSRSHGRHHDDHDDTMGTMTDRHEKTTGEIVVSIVSIVVFVMKGRRRVQRTNT
jgi:hypothetical protein